MEPNLPFVQLISQNFLFWPGFFQSATLWGGTKPKSLCLLSLELWDYCLSHNIRLKAVYYRGTDNSRADSLSRFFSDNHD